MTEEHNEEEVEISEAELEARIAEVEEEEVLQACKYCSTECPENHAFCHVCGGGLQDARMDEQLGIKIGESDIGDYITTGTMEFDIKVGKLITVRLRNLTVSEHTEAQQRADLECNGKNASAETYTLIRDKYELAFGLMGVNGKGMPQRYGDKVERVNAMGIELCAIMSLKLKTLHAAIGEAVQEGQLVNFY